MITLPLLILVLVLYFGCKVSKNDSEKLIDESQDNIYLKK